MGGRAGLDYAAVKVVADLIGVEMGDHTLGLLQMVEAERIKAWGEEEKKREALKKSLSWQNPSGSPSSNSTRDVLGDPPESGFRPIKYRTS